MTTYVLTLNGEPKQTTESLDHATAWKLKGDGYNYTEVPLYNSVDLACYTREGCIYIETDEPIAQVLLAPNGGATVDFFTSEKDLDKCNFTDDLKREIQGEVERLGEFKQEQAGRDEHHAEWMQGNERI